MKPKLLVHQSQARTITNPVEVERLLAQGWLLAKSRPKTKDAKRVRTLRAQRRADGWVSLWLWFSPDQVAAIKAAKRPKETWAGLLLRLVAERSLL